MMEATREMHEGWMREVLLEGGRVYDNPEGFKDDFVSQKLAFLRPRIYGISLIW
jgi:hypothetical protein